MLNFQAFYLPGLLFLSTVALGFLVESAGRPYHQLLFNFHKLAALAGVALIILRLVGMDYFDAPSLIGLLPFLLAAVGTVSLFITGALMSIQADLNPVVLFFHRIGPVIITLCLAWAYFLL